MKRLKFYLMSTNTTPEPWRMYALREAVTKIFLPKKEENERLVEELKSYRTANPIQYVHLDSTNAYSDAGFNYGTTKLVNVLEPFIQATLAAGLDLGKGLLLDILKVTEHQRGIIDATVKLEEDVERTKFTDGNLVLAYLTDPITYPKERWHIADLVKGILNRNSKDEIRSRLADAEYAKLAVAALSTFVVLEERYEKGEQVPTVEYYQHFC
ncbi:hypothetical protein ACIFOE_04655 [Paenibacillus sp. NRS-1783]|uniref:hypothetical protein n=1 Tax=Paenibacillus sp. NRS-1783 TaxID=3233907 RepID=UPI003D2C8882